MSYILEAIKKAENDSPSDVTSAHRAADVFFKRSKWWSTLALVAVMVNIALLAYILTSREQDPETLVSNSPAKSSKVLTPPVQINMTQSKPAPVQIASTPAKTAEVVQAVPTASTTPKERKTVEPLAQEVDIVEHHQAKSVVAARRTENAPDSARDPVMDDLQVALSIPMLSEKSDNFRASVPPVTVDIHVFSDNPSKRFVMVDMIKYQEGNEMQNGIIIDRITPQGLSLSYNNERFQISVQ